ncbi:hypothetical protein GGF32_007678 [Allomyces javanicus]|nr:hypothetical protein GGF32_007678 [Allomyces javanicus]
MLSSTPSPDADDDLWAPRVAAAADTLTLADLNRELESLRSAVLDRAAALDLDAHIHQPDEDPIEVVPDTTSDAALMDVAGLLQAMESADEWLGVLDGRFDALNAQLDALLGALGEEEDEEGEEEEGDEGESEGDEQGDVGETVVAEAAKRVAAASKDAVATTTTAAAVEGPRKPLAHADAGGVEVAHAVVTEEAK